MEKRIILVVLGLLASASVLAQAYRWVDAEGIVHYSDRPEAGAERVELSEYSRDTGARLYRAPAQSSSSAEQQAATEEPFRYEGLSVTSPGSEETLWNIEGVLSVSLALNPGLLPGHQVRVYHNGRLQSVAGTSFQLENVFRGEHNIQAEVVDSTGRLMIRSEARRFYVQQNTLVTNGR